MQWWFRRRAIAAASVVRVEADDVAAHPIRATAAPFQVPSLASATRDYAHAVAAGTLDRLDERDLMRLRLAMGPEIWAWQRALHLTGQAPWRAAPAVEARYELVRADRKMNADVETWERALAELDGETARVRLYGKPIPPPLFVPAAVMSLIEARRAAALERATRKRDQAGGGRSAPAPEGIVHPPSPPV